MDTKWTPGYTARPWATLTENWRKLEEKASPPQKIVTQFGIAVVRKSGDA